ncbi:MAG: hypothetical protein JG781_1243 [Peptococcaceae bacterium]|nr:hypothetical protein [Peptococcaceae bacterium]
MRISDLNILKGPFLSLNLSFRQIIQVFSQYSFSALPVMDGEGKYVGIIKAQDIFAHLEKLSYESSIKQLCHPHEPVKEKDKVFQILEQNHFEIIPVVNSENILSGFITKTDLMDSALKWYKKNADRFNQVVSSSYNGIIAIDAEGEIFVFNPAAERILERDSKEYLGKHILELDPASGLIETLEKGSISIGVKTLINGKTILTNRSPLVYNGQVVGAMGVFLDISTLESVTEELNKHRALVRKFNAIIESSYDGLYICDRNGIVTHVNTAWERICGIPRDQVVGKSAYNLVAEGLYNKSAATKALETKKTCTVMLEMTSGPKASQKIMATGTPVFDENGDIEQVVVNVRDITELENLKKQLDDIRHYASELQEMHIQQFKIDDIVAQSPAMQRILELVTRVSRVESTVLITGESGVGKEVIAKKIHLLSKRQNKPLIKINCGAIPENLLESELFGYEGGAFTGARKEGKPGMFELASEGTLFLDEIGELPLNLQVKLLRAIQEKEIIRVGGLKAIPVDVRIIAATNKDLASMVRKGTFREDLFYRLNVVNINIPPLRQRREDIIPLLFEVLKKFNAKYGLDKKLTGPVVERLLQYDWPGNVRELENLVERLVVLVNEPHVQVMHLPEFLQENRAKSKAITVNGIVPLKTAIEDVEAQLIEHALKEHRTTRKVAQLLEVNQSTIVRKIKYYNICREDAQENQNEVWVHQIRI